MSSGDFCAFQRFFSACVCDNKCVGLTLCLKTDWPEESFTYRRELYLVLDLKCWRFLKVVAVLTF